MTKLPLYLKRAAPSILSVIASAGVVATALKDGTPCYIIDMIFLPETGYEE